MNKKTYKKDKPAFGFQLGKVPPNSKSLEASILGAIMLEKGAFDIAIEIIKSECFYVDAHKKIFAAMEGLQNRNSPIDIETIFDELRRREEIDSIGGPFALTQLTKSVFSAANIEAHCKIIYQKYLQREVIRISSEAIGNAYEDSCDAFDLVDQTEKEISGINNITSKSYSNIQDEVVSVLNNIYALKNSGKELIGVNTGFKAMNQLTCGWQSPDFIVLAARPSVGKTALALRLARNANCPVGFFSLEMNKRQLIQRILSAESGIHLENIIRGRLSEDELDMLSTVAVDLKNFMIDDKAAPNIYELRNKA
ncbi:MAG TPA: DnaB-like helicase C-terminal domain-containing protein, partial [Hanamia sp.]